MIWITFNVLWGVQRLILVLAHAQLWVILGIMFMSLSSILVIKLLITSKEALQLYFYLCLIYLDMSTWYLLVNIMYLCTIYMYSIFRFRYIDTNWHNLKPPNKIWFGISSEKPFHYLIVVCVKNCTPLQD